MRPLWDEWNLFPPSSPGERFFPNKERFIEEALRAAEEGAEDVELDTARVREWIRGWEKETHTHYGRLPDGTRGYGLRAILSAVGGAPRGRRKVGNWVCRQPL